MSKNRKNNNYGPVSKKSSAATVAATGISLADAYTNVVLGMNPTATYDNAEKLAADLYGQKLKVLSEDQRKIGTRVFMDDPKKPVLVYVISDGTEIEVDLTKAFVGRKIQTQNTRKELGTAASANTARKELGTKPSKPQPKTFGKGAKETFNKVAKKATGKAASTAVTEASAEKRETETNGALSQEEYETLLIKEFIRINRPSDIQAGGTKGIRVPSRTSDGSNWELIDKSRLTWTLKNKRFKDTILEISIMDVQWMFEEAADK